MFSCVIVAIFYIFLRCRIWILVFYRSLHNMLTQTSGTTNIFVICISWLIFLFGNDLDCARWNAFRKKINLKGCLHSSINLSLWTCMRDLIWIFFLLSLLRSAISCHGFSQIEEILMFQIISDFVTFILHLFIFSSDVALINASYVILLRL